MNARKVNRCVAFLAGSFGLLIVLTGCGAAEGKTNTAAEAVASDGWMAMSPVGQATFLENHAGITGTADVLLDVSDRSLWVSFANVQFPSGTADLTGSLVTLPAGQECLVDNSTIDFPVADGLVPLGSILDDEWDNEPQLLRTLALGINKVLNPNGADLTSYLSESQLATECTWGSVAEAPITWNLVDRRPNLLAVDGGAREGANGEVTLESGQPAAYVIAEGDSADAIAERFGISRDDLGFLNPYFDFSGYIEPGDILVLSKAWRGLNAKQSNNFGTPGWIAPPQ